ncbi:MAG: Response regulator receiver sensor signal transduction histidine kinase [Candidatus Moranbacteria bacterium GW2011_GWF2_36_839]|nr:MAG: Response regulator receiver sensor signal transduction histidine kinase [Candidatus Moranbacteria bacterium GW2011_GWF1_36_78]KKQ17127.1 MAG: Response regulator receiver sensor signal transduction histidine kinase [Candidatus Moranbacteria bacterium GW2011_GWF2_36_839]HAT74119.1 response regulator [Candidatus Moranbacteria bacterium]HBY10673.1 response regulator [Candidatus Moranbacteria bacterium]
MDATKKTIMIVEDDTFVMDIYETKIAKDGMNVISANNGMEAIKKLEEGAKPDLILLDILMPYMNGLEFLKKVKEDENLKNIPIVLLTNLSQKEEIQEGIGLGAKDYLIKSHFTPSEVMEKINKYLQ